MREDTREHRDIDNIAHLNYPGKKVMEPNLEYDWVALGANLQISGSFVFAERCGSGHIHDTFAACYDQEGRRVRYIHQRINQTVFKDPVSLMDNFARVTAHIQSKLLLAGADQIERRVLKLIPTIEGKTYYLDGEGNYWRTYWFIENARTYDTIQSLEQAFEAAKAIGTFQKLLVDLPGPRLAETIPNFHNTPLRFGALGSAIKADVCNRCTLAKKEIDFIDKQAPMLNMFLKLQTQGELPERVIHNDTKVNNVLIDMETSEAICVIDLDTVMSGLVPYDFGDMVRTATSSAREDERELSKVILQVPMFEALVRGYLASAGEFLNQTEKDCLVFSGRLITLEMAIRFLTDYFAGDSYFKVHREGHNLDRCRTQLKLFEELKKNEEKMQKVVEQVVTTCPDLRRRS